MSALNDDNNTNSDGLTNCRKNNSNGLVFQQLYATPASNTMRERVGSEEDEGMYPPDEGQILNSDSKRL